MTEDELNVLRSDIRALDEMAASRGYAILLEAIEKDVLAASFALADNPVMTEKEVDFRRGAISAARNMLTAVRAIRIAKENDLLLASAQAEVRVSPLSATAQ
jgi:hypothetical protein